MATKTPTKSAIGFDEFRVWQETRLENFVLVTRWYFSAGYKLEFANDEAVAKPFSEELKGVDLATAQTLYNAIEAKAKLKEAL